MQKKRLGKRYRNLNAQEGCTDTDGEGYLVVSVVLDVKMFQVQIKDEP